MLVDVQMKRGGTMKLNVEGRAIKDRDGIGRRFTAIEIDSISWPYGGTVDEKNIADMHQVEDAFYEAYKKEF